jgi:hypothetical protein
MPRIKSDPVKFGHFKEWRKQYVNEKKDALSSPPIVVAAVPFEKVRENIISQITYLMCRVDWQDYELRNVWTALESLRRLVSGKLISSAGFPGRVVRVLHRLGDKKDNETSVHSGKSFITVPMLP